MQAVLRNRSMNCFQTVTVQLTFLSLKFFKLIPKVSSMHYYSLMKLLQSVLLKLIMALKLDSWYFFFFTFFFLSSGIYWENENSDPRIYEGRMGILIISFTLTCVCQQRKFTVMILSLRSKVSLH